ncbi:Bug family tripartite tricarboxylate transporter substrate binding protein [Plastoroseomonas hellenica]|uniref:Tripartite tricarboxylate transporter substrate binding protein n=1 Tax=Plastoroseomonas hellenica TaxID=2687306 RepID=A0ABS5F609_9PROT|nr:tripartite tricarboxylate transporter substrate binding protein [Plastoroseomonas hellenica]MBR0642232.1 tripartite tricarboxylate transporter substrate binding protein [Plastoroseomonas hellenica]MBR0667998.1 tripartite tricarboxylate transporter substrate binding protein [Plastoroseomonas hellenica]
MGAITLLPGAARAQAGFPAQPLRLIVPFAPAGTTDLTARLVAQGLGERLGQTVVVENRPGAGAMVGSEAVARSTADGYTLVMSNIASHAISPSLYPTGAVRYDPVRDFTHIALVTSNPSVWVANLRSGIADVAALLQRARSQRGGLDVASSGAGSSNHLLIVQLAQVAGVSLNHVPYRGAGPAMTAVIAGEVPAMSDSLPSAAAHVRQGSVRAIAMSSETRHPGFPEVPTFREQGLDIVSTSWFGISGPAGLPAAVVARLNAEIRAVLATQEVRARFAEFGGTPGDMDAAAYGRFVAAEFARWAPVVKASGAEAG